MNFAQVGLQTNQAKAQANKWPTHQHTFFFQRPSHQMWHGNVNNQKGLVATPQNTFCRLTL